MLTLESHFYTNISCVANSNFNGEPLNNVVHHEITHKIVKDECRTMTLLKSFTDESDDVPYFLSIEMIVFFSINESAITQNDETIEMMIDKEIREYEFFGSMREKANMLVSGGPWPARY